MQERKRIRPIVYGLALYFLLGATDSLNIGALGSLLKAVAMIPMALAMLDLKHLRLRAHPLLGLQVLFWFLAVASILYSVDASRTLSSCMTLTLNLVLVFLLGWMEQYNERELRLLEKAMLWGSWVTVGLILAFSNLSTEGRLTMQLGATTQDQNYINGYFLYAFSYHCNRFLVGRRKKHLIPAVFLLVVVLMTGSRGALLAFVMTGFVQICIFFSDSKHAVRNVLIVAVLLVFLGLIFDVILEQLPPTVAQRFSWEYIATKGTVGRSRIWNYLWKRFCNNSMFRMLFGNGYGTTTVVNEMNHYVAHNLYLDNLTTLGIWGVLLQLATQFTTGVLLLKHRKYALLGAYVGMMAMCLSLSLTAYKPIWNIMLLALAIDCQTKQKREAFSC